MTDTSGTTEISDFNNHSFTDENILRFEVSMEHTFGSHHYEGLYNLFEYSKDFLNAQLLIFLFEVIEKVAFLAVLHYNF